MTSAPPAAGRPLDPAGPRHTWTAPSVGEQFVPAPGVPLRVPGWMVS